MLRMHSGNGSGYTERASLPPLKLDQLLNLTDSTGIFQHAIFAIPNRKEGYCTDDNARALMLSAMLERSNPEHLSLARMLTKTYLSFIHSAYDESTRRFRNFMQYSRIWINEIPSEDCHGRALWGLAICATRSTDEHHTNVASSMFREGLYSLPELHSMRAAACAILGLCEYGQSYPNNPNVMDICRKLSERLIDKYDRNSDSTWNWFEDNLTYGNASLPHALIESGRLLNRQRMVDVGLKSLEWIMNVQMSEQGNFRPIGNNGFFSKGSTPAKFDQQPIETHASVCACLSAYRTTGDEKWYSMAVKTFQWYTGANDVGLALLDPSTGGCRDGLHADRVNQNQGAESCLSFYLSLLEMQDAARMIANDSPPKGD